MINAPWLYALSSGTENVEKKDDRKAVIRVTMIKTAIHKRERSGHPEKARLREINGRCGKVTEQHNVKESMTK